MTKCKWYKLQFHEWEYIFDKYNDSFMKEEYYKYFKSYRKCKKCGAAYQKMHNFENSWWRELNNEEKRILNKHIVIDTVNNFLTIL